VNDTMSDLEARLAELFAAQAGALDVPSRDHPDLGHLRPARRLGHPRGRYVLVAAALVTTMVLSAVWLVSARSGPATVDAAGPDPDAGEAEAPLAPPPVADRFHVETKQVSLTADALTIDVGDRTFGTAATPIEVRSDPGTRNEYTTLELTWREHDVEMRLYAYFASDGRDWWSNEIRTYDGNAQGEWIYYTGEFFRSPLGTAFAGDLDVTGTDHGVTGRLRLPNLRLQAFLPPAACAAPIGPYALEAAYDVLDVRLDASGFGTTVTLLDTATCLPVPDPDDFVYDWTIDDGAVATVTPDGPRADLAPVRPGTTTLLVIARDPLTGAVLAEVAVPVTVE